MGLKGKPRPAIKVEPLRRTAPPKEPARTAPAEPPKERERPREKTPA